MHGLPFARHLIRRISGCAPLMLVLVSGSQLGAQSTVARLAEREAARRQQQVISAADDIQRADSLMREGRVEDAVKLFDSIYTALPDAPLSEELKKVARVGLVQAGCERARQLMIEGQRTEADALVERLLVVSPQDRRVLGLKKEFGDPDRYPPALTAAHVGNVKEVQRLLILANSALEIGDYDRSIKIYQDALRIDAANAAARRGMEQAEQQKAKYLKSAYDQQRSKRLAEVDRTWEDPVPARSSDVSLMFGAMVGAQSNVESGRQRILNQLRTLRLPKVDFSGATIAEVVELLRIRSRDLDPAGKGIDFVINVDETAANKPISLVMDNVPMDELLRYVTELAGVAYRVEDFAVQITSLGERNNAIISRTFRVPPDFIQNSPAASAPAGNDPFAPAGGAGGGLTLRKMGAKEFLESQGVPFPEGSSASFNGVSSTLIVRNSVANMEMVETLVEMATKAAPKMAVIHVRMLEVNQTNLDELGFDWLLGGVGWSGNSLLVGGGTSGNGTTFNAANYPFGNTAAIPPVVVNGTQVFPAQNVAAAVGGPVPLGVPVANAGGGGPVTAGLRSGGYATGAQALDSLLATGSATASPTVAPGVLSLAGVFTNPQFQVVMRGLSQKKGVDINASPSVTTKSGVKAVAEITREVIYPTEFDPPQLPQNNRLIATNLIATPTTPTAFETRKTGVVVEVEPVISEDGKSVEVTIAPELTDFEGFVNYGSAIFAPTSSSFIPVTLPAGLSAFVPLVQPERLITPNTILQPIFKTQKVVTSVKVFDGATVVLGGARIQRKTIVDDSVPILGNLPYLGRLFRSAVTQTETKNIIIFVTVDVIDPSGQKINKDTASLVP
jgi:general secretion pathway protein D